ncbi:reverse transcriptase domain-containing protein [Tanacetum coccineum]
MRHRDTINATAGCTFMKRRPEECYDLIKNMTAHHNDWDTSAQRSESSSFVNSSNPEIVALKLEMAEIDKNLIKNVYAAGAYNQGGNSYQPQGNHNLLSYCSDNYLGPPGFNVNQNQNRNNQNQNQDSNQGNNQGRNQFFQGANHNPALAYQAPALAYQAPPYQAPVHQALIPQSQVVEPETEVTKDTVPLTNNGSIEDVQPSVVQVENHVLISEPVVDPVSVLMPNPKPSIPYPSRRNNERRREKANDQIEKFYEIFKDLSFQISLMDALILMPKFASTLKVLIGNKEKISEMARTPLNELCLAVILNKLPEKLGDPDKFLIPCDFLRMDKCLALADLDASINLMPLSMCKTLSLPELTPTCMTLELADRSISQPIGITKDVYVKVGKFQFLADFVVVEFDADPRVPLILGRSFLKTGPNYNDMMVNRIDIIEIACKEYSQEVLGFSDVIASSNPTPYYDPIISTSSLTLTPFGDSDFLLEEVDAFLALEDDPTSQEVDHSYYDPKGDIPLLEAFLNDDPSLPPPT